MSERFEVNWDGEIDWAGGGQATAPSRWWRMKNRWLPRVFGSVAAPEPAEVPFTHEIQPALLTGNPALDLLVERVCQATHHWDYGRDDVAIIVNEALWQIGHLVRLGATVEVPELGTFQRRVDHGGLHIVYQPDPGLKGTCHV
jgi:hypothetical protein